MSTAEHHIPLGYARLAPPSRRLGRATTAGVERLILVLGLSLPVPAFAATGLSVPLPSVVERIAAALVPWAEAGVLSEQALEREATGVIVFTPDEPKRGSEAAALAPASATPRARPRKTQPRPGRTTAVAAARSTDTERMRAAPRAAEPRQVPHLPADSGGDQLSPSERTQPKPDKEAQPKSDRDVLPKLGKDAKRKPETVLSPAPTDTAALAPKTLDKAKETGVPVVEEAKAKTTAEPVIEEAQAKKTVDAVTGG